MTFESDERVVRGLAAVQCGKACLTVTRGFISTSSRLSLDEEFLLIVAR
jgi:hypothetical protein